MTPPVHPGLSETVARERQAFLEIMLHGFDETAPSCEDCIDEDRYTDATVVWLGRFYCAPHAESADVAGLARWWNRARELGVPS